MLHDVNCVRLRLCAGASVVALAMVLVASLAHAGAWKVGRATFYGSDEWSIHTGALPRSVCTLNTPDFSVVTAASTLSSNHSVGSTQVTVAPTTMLTAVCMLCLQAHAATSI